MPNKPHYTLKPAVKPLPSQMRANEAADNALATDQAAEDPAFYRAASEDDDGYDPYSDRQERVPFFEEDPWN